MEPIQGDEFCAVIDSIADAFTRAIERRNKYPKTRDAEEAMRFAYKVLGAITDRGVYFASDSNLEL